MILYRPVGVRELELMAESGFRCFPPRLPIQPIFYPVLNCDYARQIAREWNTVDRNSGYAGFVTRFEVQDAFARRYEVKTVGADKHQELWVPSEELDEFNRHLAGPIEVIEAFTGSKFEGRIDRKTNLPDGVHRT